MKKDGEFNNFDLAMRKVISVSHEELKRREEQWKKEHPTAGKKRGRKKHDSGGGRGQ